MAWFEHKNKWHTFYSQHYGYSSFYFCLDFKNVTMAFCVCFSTLGTSNKELEITKKHNTD
jgi:hypothetical protein